MKIEAEYTSVWDARFQDGPGYEITTKCTVDIATGQIEAESSDESVDGLDLLDRAYVEYFGEKFMADKDDPEILCGDDLVRLQDFSLKINRTMRNRFL